MSRICACFISLVLVSCGMGENTRKNTDVLLGVCGVSLVLVEATDSPKLDSPHARAMVLVPTAMLCAASLASAMTQ